MKLLTVTVPCYNSQAYMRACIDSLLPGGDRVEVIIIDDGSTDDTGRIADEYVEKYPNICRVIHQENGGHGEGINQGIRHATGKYFKVVDSDDKLSEDFVGFLDQLEQLDGKGGLDLFVTNYYYVHADGVGDRSINYSNALPQYKIFTWEETEPFRIHQLLTLHSCTFRTELMRRWPIELPKHTFYEDNLMVSLTLLNVEKMAYRNSDLYRYTIGREGQSVQESSMKKRYTHQVLVSQLCFCNCHIDDIQSPRKRKYVKHELFMMLGIATVFARLVKTDEADQVLAKMWEACAQHDEKWANHFRKRTALWCINLPGKGGRSFTNGIYHLANKVVRFNQ